MVRTPETGSDRRFGYLVGIIAIAVPFLVGYLMFSNSGTVQDGENKWVYLLPHLNAAINGSTSALLVAGLVFIKRNQIARHRNSMISAFILGSIFLVSYIIYHSTVPSTSFGGTGWLRTVYYVLLISHILLAVVVVPLVIMALYFALSDRIEQHRKTVKFAYPVWLYVSVSGVLVYFMISPYY